MAPGVSAIYFDLKQSGQSQSAADGLTHAPTSPFLASARDLSLRGRAAGTLPPGVERRSRLQVGLAVTGVLLGTMLQAVDGSIVNVAVPQIQKELGGSL